MEVIVFPFNLVTVFTRLAFKAENLALVAGLVCPGPSLVKVHARENLLFKDTGSYLASRLHLPSTTPVRFHCPGCVG